MSLSSILGLAASCFFFFGVGIVALVWPKRIQEWTLNLHESGGGVVRWNPLLNWMRTSGYITSLRIVGALSIGAGCLVLVILTQRGAHS